MLTAALSKSRLLIWLCALQVKSPELFEEWVSKLRHHRVFRQNEIAMYPHERHLFHPHATSSPSLNDSLRKVRCSGARLLEIIFKKHEFYLKFAAVYGCYVMWLIISCLSFNNRGQHLQNRRQSTRQRSALGSTPQRTWTSAAKVGRCFVDFYLLIYCLLASVSTLPCHQCLKVNLTPLILIMIYLSLRLGGMWVVPAGAQPAAEEHGGPPSHVLGPGH